jgi:hypothetical protein
VPAAYNRLRDGFDVSKEKPRLVVSPKIKFGSTKDLPVLYAHQIVVNFTGNEFYVSVYAFAPEPWSAGELPATEIEARPLARFAFSTLSWLANVESLAVMTQKLEEEGSITAEQRAAAVKMLGVR